MSAAIEAKLRRGEPVTRLDKIAAETDLSVLDAMVRAWSGRGEVLSADECRAVADRRAELLAARLRQERGR